MLVNQIGIFQVLELNYLEFVAMFYFILFVSNKSKLITDQFQISRCSDS